MELMALMAVHGGSWRLMASVAVNGGSMEVDKMKVLTSFFHFFHFPFPLLLLLLLLLLLHFASVVVAAVAAAAAAVWVNSLAMNSPLKEKGKATDSSKKGL